VHEFSGGDGIRPNASLLKAGDGLLYGSTIAGGASGLGTLFRLNPAQPASPPTLLELLLNPWAVVGGSTSTATVTLGWAAPAGGATVSLSSNSRYASVPSRVTVPEGATRASFTITTRRVKRMTYATIVASYNASSATAMFGITP